MLLYLFVIPPCVVSSVLNNYVISMQIFASQSVFDSKSATKWCKSVFSLSFSVQYTVSSLLFPDIKGTKTPARTTGQPC